jgi:hypothetical protein
VQAFAFDFGRHFRGDVTALRDLGHHRSGNLARRAASSQGAPTIYGEPCGPLLGAAARPGDPRQAALRAQALDAR